MSEREKKIMESISEALPKMSEFDKGYLLGSAERMVSEKEKSEKENNDVKSRIGDFGGQRNKYKQRYIHLREVI